MRDEPAPCPPPRSLMTHGSWLLALLLVFGCKPVQSVIPQRGVPRIRATVITIRTTIQPENRTLLHSIMITSDVARSSDEIDRWRLIDLRHRRVTFVDDIQRTYWTESLELLVKRRQEAMKKQVGNEIPRVQFTSTGARRSILGVEAAQSLIRAGAYQRELWIAVHPAIPPELFAMMYVSRAPSSSIAAMMKAADDALSNVRGFPLIDHTELPYGSSRLVIDHTVVAVGQRHVAQSWLTIPRRYRDVTQPTAGEPTSPRERILRLMPTRR